MRRRRDEPDDEPGDEPVPEDVEAEARAAGFAICDRFQSAYPPVEALAEDEEFDTASQRLAHPDVPFEVVGRLSRSTTPVVAALAHRAAALRDDATRDWLDWAPLWSERSHLFSVAGIGAYPILAPEHGPHVLETPEGGSSFDHVTVHVSVAPRLPAPPQTDPLEQAREALAAVEPPNAIVRRYRAQPSPLVRDAAREWRTGWLDRVLAGDFDVMGGDT